MQANEVATRTDVFTEALARLKSAATAADYAAGMAAAGHAAQLTPDYTQMRSLARQVKRLQACLPESVARQELRIAVLSSFTTDQLVEFLAAFLQAAGLAVKFYTAAYGTFRQEILDPNSDLYQFQPHIAWIAIDSKEITNPPGLAADTTKVQACLRHEVAVWQNIWTLLQVRAGCQIIQDNFVFPAWRTLGNHEMRHGASLGGFVARLNIALADAAPSHVCLHDVAGLATSIGLQNWHDPSLYHMAKMPCAANALVEYAHSVASVVLALRGRSRKCLVLDLDNTLWGGVIGDDGLQGIRLGQGDPVGEAFQEFQRYALSLRERGILLAVCSKNDDVNAKSPFEQHSDMVLKLEHISCFVANWEDKASNLRHIAKQLNIGLDALVFADDNPAERDIIRRLLPEVGVPELPEDPANYIASLERQRYFQVVSLEAEDFKRADYYKANAERDALLKTTSGDMEDFLQSLEMTGRIEPINPITLERSVQLTNKSNQFNLTTRRYTNADVLARIADPNWLCLSVALKDKFGDNGLISVILAQTRDDALRIDTWLMSCRVLKRGVERYALSRLAEEARQRGLTRLVGEYIPSAKNSMVAEHYAQLGFQPIPAPQGAAEGSTHWMLDIGPSWQCPAFFIQEA